MYSDVFVNVKADQVDRQTGKNRNKFTYEKRAGGVTAARSVRRVISMCIQGNAMPRMVHTRARLIVTREGSFPGGAIEERRRLLPDLQLPFSPPRRFAPRFSLSREADSKCRSLSSAIYDDPSLLSAAPPRTDNENDEGRRHEGGNAILLLHAASRPFSRRFS